MTDTFTKQERSRIMSKIKGKDTKPEVLFRKILFSEGLRYRKNYPIEGKPDIVFVSKKIAIFIDGCFWHGCKKHCRMPHSNKEYWLKKIKGNIQRDKKNSKILKIKGWRVLRIWEHEIQKKPENALNKVKKFIEK